MPYHTMMLTLLQERPALHEAVRRLRQLWSVQHYAQVLKTSHEAWKAALAREQPKRDPSQVTAAVLELSLEELADALPPIPDEPNPTEPEEAIPLLRRSHRGGRRCHAGDCKRSSLGDPSTCRG